MKSLKISRDGRTNRRKDGKGDYIWPLQLNSGPKKACMSICKVISSLVTINPQTTSIASKYYLKRSHEYSSTLIPTCKLHEYDWKYLQSSFGCNEIVSFFVELLLIWFSTVTIMCEVMELPENTCFNVACPKNIYQIVYGNFTIH